MRKFICITLLLAFAMKVNAQSETLFFDVIHNEKKTGSLKAEKSTDGSNVHYVSSTIIEFHVFTKIEIVYNYDVKYLDDKLNNSAVKIKVHGHVKTDVVTKRVGSEYVYLSEGEEVRRIPENIYFSLEKMFFVEPVGVTKVYAEEHGEFHDLKKTKDHVYMKTDSSGHESLYYYKNGDLQRAEIDAGLISFSIVLRE